MKFLRRGLTDLSLQGSLTAAKRVRRGLGEDYFKKQLFLEDFFWKSSHSPLLTSFPDSGEARKERSKRPLLTSCFSSVRLAEFFYKVLWQRRFALYPFGKPCLETNACFRRSVAACLVGWRVSSRNSWNTRPDRRKRKQLAEAASLLLILDAFSWVFHLRDLKADGLLACLSGGEKNSRNFVPRRPPKASLDVFQFPQDMLGFMVQVVRDPHEAVWWNSFLSTHILGQGHFLRIPVPRRIQYRLDHIPKIEKRSQLRRIGHLVVHHCEDVHDTRRFVHRCLLAKGQHQSPSRADDKI